MGPRALKQLEGDCRSLITLLDQLVHFGSGFFFFLLLIHVLESQQTVSESTTDVCFPAGLCMMRRFFLLFFFVMLRARKEKKNLTHVRPSPTLRSRCDFIATSACVSGCAQQELKNWSQLLLLDRVKSETLFQVKRPDVSSSCRETNQNSKKRFATVKIHSSSDMHSMHFKVLLQVRTY